MLATTQRDAEYNFEITPSEILTAIKRMRNLAIGPGSIHTAMLKKLNTFQIDQLTKFMERWQSTMGLEISARITDKKTLSKN